MLTPAEKDAVYEALRDIVGVRRAQALLIACVASEPEMIGKAHAAPARPRAVEP